VTGSPEPGRSVTDPIGLLVELVLGVEHGLDPERIRAAVTAVAGGRAKSRRLAAALERRPGVLRDGRSPAPRAVGDLLLELRKAGAEAICAPVCAACGKVLGSFQRRGQDWYCALCGPVPEACARCGNIRPVSSRDRAGHPRCQQCPEIDGRDPVQVVYALITELDPRASRESVAAALQAAAPKPSYRQKIAWALEAEPALLTGAGHRAPLRAIPRLIEMLHAADVAGIVLPACPGCHRVVHIDKPLNGARVCRTCIAHSRIETCARCGARREPVTRDEGRPVCANCFIADPANLETCVGCGRRRRVERRSEHGPLCSGCPTLPAATCSICGQDGPCGTSRATGRPWCPPCQRRVLDCSGCARHAPITSGTLTAPLCAECTPPPPWRDCPTCSNPDHPDPGTCSRCVINRRLEEVMGPGEAPLPPGLDALRHQIATAEHPITAQRWLTKPATAPILSDLATGKIPLTHQALDELPDTQPLAHLRQTLVATGALPERDELMVRLEAHLADLLASQPSPERRKLLYRYLNWHLVRRLRTRNNGRAVSRQQFIRIQRLARGAIALLDWLEAHGLALDSLRQADLDRWLTDENATYREEAGLLIRWAHTNKITSIRIGTTRWSGPTRPLDHQHRWDTARCLLHDADLKPEDRLAGLLILLYAQGVSAISRITLDQIHTDPDQISIRLGRVPIHLPEPVATLARTVVANRKGHATIGAQTPSPWLFPGGQPGLPISTQQLTKRLSGLGIRPSPDRSTALIQLATEIPAAILARTLGIQTDAAVSWQRHASGDWATYAAEISRRRS
jgi:hypothetical protein